ncbi:hypothetical protein EB796_004216 [Bugula neritina]|uniref:Apple domain-containing protein n=1 Tax=Bugula neritina TaxID=10212 RepID=A0A7J7KFV3_BUGNE|nr:hypothetical protein EB796_004216 [Bugula neritina]
MIFAALLVNLTAVAVSGYQAVLYKSDVMSESLSNTSKHDSGTAISTSHCAFYCMKKEKCNGFTYDWQIKKCTILTCVNPNFYFEGNSYVFDFYIKADVRKFFGKALARNKSAKLSSEYVETGGQYYTYDAAKAVDGIYEPTDGVYASIAHSEVENRPWWRVDLGDVHCVWAFNILNRFESR